MFNEFYGLTLDPFRLSPDPRFCYRHRNFAKAKAYMEYALGQGEGFVMVTGQPGTGKTTLIEDLLADATATNVRIARMMGAQVGADDLLRLVASAFGIDTSQSTKAATLLNLQTVLTRQMESGNHSLLIVDEAQNLPRDSMEELRMITNLQLGARPLLQVFLVGQGGLLDLVAQPNMEQLRQRILAACSMEPLSLDDTREYLKHRLRRAGWAGKPGISGEAVWRIHGTTGGIPRRINLLASRLLLHGYIEGRLSLDEEDVDLVTAELSGEFLVADRHDGGSSLESFSGLDPDPDFVSLAIEIPLPAAPPEATKGRERAPPTMPAQAELPTEKTHSEHGPAEGTEDTPSTRLTEVMPPTPDAQPDRTPASDAVAPSKIEPPGTTTSPDSPLAGPDPAPRPARLAGTSHNQPAAMPPDAAQTAPLNPLAQPSSPPQELKTDRAFASDPGKDRPASKGVVDPNVATRPNERTTSPDAVLRPFAPPKPAAPPPAPVARAVVQPAAMPTAPAFGAALQHASHSAVEETQGTGPTQIQPDSTVATSKHRRSWIGAVGRLIAVAVLAAAAVLAIRPDWVKQTIKGVRAIVQQHQAQTSNPSAVPGDSAKAAARLPSVEVSSPPSQTGAPDAKEAIPAAVVPTLESRRDSTSLAPALGPTGLGSVSADTTGAPPPNPDTDGAALPTPSTVMLEPLTPAPTETKNVDMETSAEPEETASDTGADRLQEDDANGPLPGHPFNQAAAATDEGRLASPMNAPQTPPAVEVPITPVPQPEPAASPDAPIDASLHDSNPVAIPKPESEVTRETAPLEIEPRKAQTGVGDNLATLTAKLATLGLQPSRTADGGISLNLGRQFQFDAGSSALNPQARALIERLGRALAGNAALNITVIGHTDDSGPKALNDSLSLQRANEVAAALTSMGVRAEQIASEGHGESEPLTRHAMDGIPAHLINRRVEVIIRGASPQTETSAD